MPPPPALPPVELVGAAVHGVDGEAAWEAQRLRKPVADCRPAALPHVSPQGDPEPCVWESVRIRSLAPRPMLCRAQVDFAYVARPDTVYSLDRRDVLHPGMLVELPAWRIVTDRELRALTARCRIVPAQLPPENAPACKVRERRTYYDDYYPPGSKRRSEEGVVVFGYSTAADSKRALDLELLASSGFLDLDRAGLKIMEHLRIEQPCPGERLRKTMTFRLVD